MRKPSTTRKNKKQIPSTVRHYDGRPEEERISIEESRRNSKTDWSKTELYDYVQNRFVNFEEFTIPREIMDDPTMFSNDKLVYGVLRRCRQGAAMKTFQIAALAGIHGATASHSIKRLKARGLIEVTPGLTYKVAGRFVQTPAKYVTIDPPKRVYKDVIPTIFLTNIEYIERKYRSYFSETEI